MFSFAHTWMLCFWPSRRDLCVLMAQSTLKHTGCSLTTLVARHCVWRTARHSGKISQRKLAVRNYNVLHTHTHSQMWYTHSVVLDCLDLSVPGAVPQYWAPNGKSSNPAGISCHTLTYTSIHMYPTSAIVGKHPHIIYSVTKEYETSLEIIWLKCWPLLEL